MKKIIIAAMLLASAVVAEDHLTGFGFNNQAEPALADLGPSLARIVTPPQRLFGGVLLNAPAGTPKGWALGITFGSEMVMEWTGDPVTNLWISFAVYRHQRAAPRGLVVERSDDGDAWEICDTVVVTSMKWEKRQVKIATGVAPRYIRITGYAPWEPPSATEPGWWAVDNILFHATEPVMAAGHVWDEPLAWDYQRRKIISSNQVICDYVTKAGALVATTTNRVTKKTMTTGGGQTVEVAITEYPLRWP